MTKPIYKFALLAVSISVSMSGDVLFSDLGPGGSYSTEFWPVYGSGLGGPAALEAALFMVAGSGSQPVTQIDLAAYDPYTLPGTFTASIWSDNAGLPGTVLPNASWNFPNDVAPGGLVSIEGISGLSLMGGEQYFMVVAPLDLSSDSYLAWYINNQGFSSLALVGEYAGTSWVLAPTNNEAFDVQGGTSAPEPSTFGLIGLTLAGMATRLRRRQLRRTLI